MWVGGQINEMQFRKTSPSSALSHVVIEVCISLRLLSRKAATDLAVGAFIVPAGWNVWPHLGDAVLHYNDDVFDPSRWLHTRGTGCPFEFSQPFGAGIRTCLGKPFMILQLKVALAVLCCGYSWELIGDKPHWTVVPTPRYRDKVGVVVTRNDAV